MTFIRKIVAIMFFVSIGSIHTMGVGRKILPQLFSFLTVSKVKKPAYVVDNPVHDMGLLPRWQFHNFQAIPKVTAEHKSSTKVRNGFSRDLQTIFGGMSQRDTSQEDASQRNMFQRNMFQQGYVQPPVHQEVAVSPSVLESNSVSSSLMVRSDSTQTLQDWRDIEHLVPSAEHE